MYCDVARCNRLSSLQYEDFGPRRQKVVSLCEYHWEKHCDDEDKFDVREYFYPSKKKRK